MSTRVSFEEIKASLKVVKMFVKVTITPALAKQLLELNLDNRPVKDRLITKYANDMRKNCWSYTGDVIKISKTGRLLDGQHRLLAIIASATAQDFNIQTGLDDRIFDVLDTGANRTAGDVLSIAGYKNTCAMQGAVKLVLSYDKKKIENSGRLKATNHEVLDWLSRNDSELMQECVIHGSALYNKMRLFSPATYSAFYYIFSRRHQEMAKDFFEKLVTGENISSTKHSAIYLLRQRLTNLQLSRKTMISEEKYALLIKAWNCFREGAEIKRLAFTDSEDFPRAK